MEKRKVEAMEKLKGNRDWVASNSARKKAHEGGFTEKMKSEQRLEGDVTKQVN